MNSWLNQLKLLTSRSPYPPSGKQINKKRKTQPNIWSRQNLRFQTCKRTNILKPKQIIKSNILETNHSCPNVKSFITQQFQEAN